MDYSDLTMKEFRALALVPREDEWPQVKRKEPTGRRMNDDAWPPVSDIDYVTRENFPRD